jgi:hypothetical protein
MIIFGKAGFACKTTIIADGCEPQQAPGLADQGPDTQGSS